MQVRAVVVMSIGIFLLTVAPVAEAARFDGQSPLLSGALSFQLPPGGTPPGPADLVITVLDTPDPVVIGGTLTYTVTVGNFGRSEARSTVARLDIPPGTNLNSLGNGCYLFENGVWCQVPPLAPGSKVTFAILVDVVAPMGPLTTMATVDPANTIFENDRTNNSALTTTIVGRGTPGPGTPGPALAGMWPAFPAATPVPFPSAAVPANVAVPANAPTPSTVNMPVNAAIPASAVSASAPAPAARPVPSAPPFAAPSLSGAASEVWLLVLAPTDVYMIRDARVGQAPTGAWYKVLIQESSWVLASGEGESPVTAGWIEVDNRVQVIPGPHRVPSSPTEPWLVVVAPTQIYSAAGAPEWIASSGERYRIVSRDQGWALAIWEGDPPSRTVWVEVDSRVQLSGADQGPSSSRR